MVDNVSQGVLPTIQLAILEDERLVREALEAYCRAEGLEVILSCGEPEQFLSRLAGLPRALEEQTPRVALIDLVLQTEDGFPLMGGLEVVRRMRELQPDVKPLIVSAMANPNL